MTVGITEVEQAKTFAQEIAAWIPLISVLAGGALTGGVAILVGRMNHHYAREREEKAAAVRRDALMLPRMTANRIRNSGSITLLQNGQNWTCRVSPVTGERSLF